ncbi:recombinase family protein [Actinomadura rudentiformis]|uniref:hypothetical protein n=1 Tax=Actinomadura rudentiformis TaxID=359158 RepID=UPI00178C7BA7|nr:hypothetical protein [Actinomadura rudentiformis]
MLAGPLTGIYDPAGPGTLLFAFFAAMAETERETIREATLEGLDAAARNCRPVVFTDDMIHSPSPPGRRAAGESVESISKDLIIPTGNGLWTRRGGIRPARHAASPNLDHPGGNGHTKNAQVHGSQDPAVQGH